MAKSDAIKFDYKNVLETGQLINNEMNKIKSYLDDILSDYEACKSVFTWDSKASNFFLGVEQTFSTNKETLSAQVDCINNYLDTVINNFASMESSIGNNK